MKAITPRVNHRRPPCKPKFVVWIYEYVCEDVCAHPAGSLQTGGSVALEYYIREIVVQILCLKQPTTDTIVSIGWLCVLSPGGGAIN